MDSNLSRKSFSEISMTLISYEQLEKEIVGDINVNVEWFQHKVLEFLTEIVSIYFSRTWSKTWNNGWTETK